MSIKQQRIRRMPTQAGDRLTVGEYALRLEAAPRLTVHNATGRVLEVGKALSGASPGNLQATMVGKISERAR